MGSRMLEPSEAANQNISDEDPLGPIVYDTLKECVDELGPALGKRGQEVKTTDMSMWIQCQVHLDPKKMESSGTTAAAAPEKTVPPAGVAPDGSIEFHKR